MAQPSQEGGDEGINKHEVLSEKAAFWTSVAQWSEFLATDLEVPG